MAYVITAACIDRMDKALVEVLTPYEVAEAATAISHAAPLVHEGAAVVPGHSSDDQR